MKKILVFFILFSQYFVDAQNIEAIYGVAFNKNPSESKDSKISAEMKLFSQKMEEAAKLFESQLIITDSISTSKTLPLLTISEDPMINALIQSFGNYVYFKSKNQKFKLANVFDKKYLINYENDFAWDIKNEEKVIQNYTCYKAVSSINDEEIVAWFCPSFQTSDGPLQFDGLPGLIFELSTNKLTYFLKIINPNSKISPEKMPSLKTITEKEFESIIKKVYNK
jgi:GLPGLI family protein